MAEVRVLIAAGGTGGHLFPALHIARALTELSTAERPVRVAFAGTGRELEDKILSGLPYERFTINIVGVKRRGVAGWLEFLRMLPRALVQTASMLRAFRPDVIVGAGGYASVLPVVAGRLSGRPVWIHESELRSGLANRVLAPLASKVSVAFSAARIASARKQVLTGQPVRPGLREAGETNLPEGAPKRLLVMGGSQGALGLDRGMIALAPFLGERGVEVWHQCRSESVASVEQGYRSAGVTARVVTFIENPVEAFAWTHVVVSRSGASSVMEIEAVNKPAVFVPYPFAQGGHQRANAVTLVEKGKALLVEEGEGFEEKLKNALAALLSCEGYARMRVQPNEARSVTAAETIARGILGVIWSAGVPPA